MLPLVLNVSYASLHVYKKLQCNTILFAFTCEVGTNNLLCILVSCFHTIAISWLIQPQLRCFFPLISGHFLFRLWKGCCNACWSHMTLTCHSGQQVRCYDSIRCIAHCHTSYLTIVLWVNGFLVHPLSLALELPTSYLRMLIGSIFYASLIMFPACLQFVFRPTEIGCQGERCSQILLLKVCLLPRNWEKLGI